MYSLPTTLCTLFVLFATAFAVGATELPRSIEPNEKTGSSAAVEVGDVPLVHTAQILPLRDDQPPPREPLDQVARVLENIDTVLREFDSGLELSVKLNWYVASADLVPHVHTALASRFRGVSKPAVSMVVTRLPHPQSLVAADAVATTTRNLSNDAVKIRATGSNAPIAARSDTASQHSVAAITPRGSRIYVSGQAESGATLSEATRKTLESLRATLEFLERTDADVVQLKAFVTPMAEAASVYQEVGQFFAGRPTPPIVLVEWKSSASTPIEIELIAWGGRTQREAHVEYLTPPGMTVSPVYSRVARINATSSIYMSGLVATDNASRVEVEHAPAAERETKDVFATLNRLLGQTNSDFRHLVKATYYVSNNDASAKLNELRPTYYDPQRPPAASKALVDDVGRVGLGLSLDMIAVPTTRRLNDP
jgi:enamine deaminase RidA (YjgF/YER057c/UK114 family)